MVVSNESNFNEEFKHVKGHKDKDKQYHELSLPTQLNVDVDIIAVAFCSQNEQSTKQRIQLPINPVQLHMGGENGAMIKLSKLTGRPSALQGNTTIKGIIRLWKCFMEYYQPINNSSSINKVVWINVPRVIQLLRLEII
eukprot:15347801-Ditylum_brightwellii.AAC.1